MKNNLTKYLTMAVLVGILTLSSAVAGDNADDGCACQRNLYNMGRGLTNIVTCWLELPRCLIYHNSQVPVMGVVVGACEGVGMTAIRAFAGVADFASFGFMSDSIYRSCHDFNEWVWEARWIPKN